MKYTSDTKAGRVPRAGEKEPRDDRDYDAPKWSLAFVLLILTLWMYLPATQCGFIWDDDYYVEKNKTLGSVEGLRKIWFDFEATQDYYPLTFTTFWLEWWLWEFQPAGYHVNNILLHALNAVLLWRFLVRLGVPGALLAASLFAIHPVHVESVAWVTERKNVLSLLFCLLSLHAYVTFQGLDQQEEGTWRPRWWPYTVSIVTFLLAMLAKTAVFPLILVLPVLVWWKRGRLGSRDLLFVLPYFLVVTPLFALAFVGEANFGGAGVNIMKVEDAEFRLSLLQRILLCGRVLWFYSAKLIWPHPLIFVYPRWEIDQHVWWQYLFPLAAVALPFILWLLRHRIGRGPLAAALVFGLMLAPASGFFNFYFQRYSYVADHLQYFASIAVTTLLAAIATQAIRYLSVQRVWFTSWAMIVVATLAVLTWRQQAAYQDTETLWTDTLTKNPDAWIAHNYLATVLQRRGKTKEALTHNREAVRIKPRDFMSHYNLANGLQRLGRLEEAVAHYQEALLIAPKYVEARNNLSATLSRLGRLDEAAEQYRQILEIDPQNFKALNGSGIVLAKQGRLHAAIEKFQQAVRLQPGSTEARNNLHRAQILLQQKPGS